MSMTTRRKWITWLLVLTGLCIAVGWWAVSWAPPYYQPAVSSTADSQTTKQRSKKLVQQVMQLADEIRHEPTFSAEFSEEEINAWLADELVRKYHSYLPREISDPRVHFDEGKIEFACRVTSSLGTVVASTEVRAWITEDHLLALEIDVLRAGRIPLPSAELTEPLVKSLSRDGRKVEWRQSEGHEILVVDLVGDKNVEDSSKSKNSGRKVIEAVDVSPGILRLRGKTVSMR